MKREARDQRENLPRPVQRIPLEETPSRRRWAAVVLALVAAAGAFWFAVHGALRVEKGWRLVESEGKWSTVFSLRYNLGTGEEAPAAELEKVRRIYTLALQQAGSALDAAEVSEEPRNLAWLNLHPNTETEVAPELYRALAASLDAGRWVFLGPLYEMNESLCASGSDAEAAQMDPRRNGDAAAFAAAVLPFARDEGAVSLRLLGDNRVCLAVSPAYLAAGEEWGITRWIDFGWQRSAFLADLVADTLRETGAVHATLTSADGFVRCLEEGAEVQLSFRSPQEVRTCRGPAALVSLSVLPGGGSPAYQYADGDRRTPWLSLEDGLDHAPWDEVAAASRETGCAGLLSLLLPLLTGEETDPDSLPPQPAVSCVLTRNGTMVQRDGEKLLESY